MTVRVITVGRERFREPEPLPDNADAVARMKHRLKTAVGKAVYAIRKSTGGASIRSDKGGNGFDRFSAARVHSSKAESGTSPASPGTSKDCMY